MKDCESLPGPQIVQFMTGIVSTSTMDCLYSNKIQYTYARNVRPAHSLRPLEPNLATIRPFLSKPSHTPSRELIGTLV